MCFRLRDLVSYLFCLGLECLSNPEWTLICENCFILYKFWQFSTHTRTPSTKRRKIILLLHCIHAPSLSRCEPHPKLLIWMDCPSVIIELYWTRFDLWWILLSYRHYLWGHALRTAAYLLIRVNTKAIKSTPYELWTSKRPSYSYMKIWGCPVYVKQLVGDKLGSRSIMCYFVGYPEHLYGYLFYYNKKSVSFEECHFFRKGVSIW